MMNFNIDELCWDKMQGLIPAIIQHANTNTVLMLGYMNKEALQKTLATELVTFYSRSKMRLWVKGETSGNQLKLTAIDTDCDKDCLLITAVPTGPVCHKGTHSCFSEKSQSDWEVIKQLEQIIQQRDQQRPEQSYVASLLNSGIQRIAQKVGEEGVEVALAAVNSPLVNSNMSNETQNFQLCEEVADLLFHVLVLLAAKKLSIHNIIAVLKKRK